MADLIVEADGGSRGNPGVAGYGALVRSAATGQVLAERAGPLGKASNNVAEYTGLIEGLRAAAAVDPGATVLVRMDSKLVVEQMAGRWKIKHEDMRRLALQARELVDERREAGGSVDFRWIPREQNKAADRLSNVGMDGDHVDRRYPPRGADEAGDEAPAETQNEAADEAPDEAPDEAGEPAASAQTREERQVPRGAAAARVRRGGGAPPDLADPARLFLVRHGPTEATVAGLLDGCGGSDAPLTAQGQRQSVAAGHALRGLLRGAPAPLLVTSTLRRARQTGAALGGVLGVDPVAESSWDEQHFGDWEGLTVPQACADPDGAASYARLRSDPTYARPGGESRAQLSARVLSAYDELAARSRQEGRAVVVVSHRAALLVVLDAVLGLGSPWSLSLSPASLTALRSWADGAATIDFVNDTAHLRG